MRTDLRTCHVHLPLHLWVAILRRLLGLRDYLSWRAILSSAEVRTFTAAELWQLELPGHLRARDFESAPSSSTLSPYDGAEKVLRRRAREPTLPSSGIPKRTGAALCIYIAERAFWQSTRHCFSENLFARITKLTALSTTAGEGQDRTASWFWERNIS